jgi:hypothetical protein
MSGLRAAGPYLLCVAVTGLESWEATTLAVGGCVVVVALALAPVTRALGLRALTMWGAAAGASVFAWIVPSGLDLDDGSDLRWAIALAACAVAAALTARLHRPPSPLGLVIASAVAGVVTAPAALVVAFIVSCSTEVCFS